MAKRTENNLITRSVPIGRLDEQSHDKALHSTQRSVPKGCSKGVLGTFGSGVVERGGLAPKGFLRSPKGIPSEKTVVPRGTGGSNPSSSALNHSGRGPFV